MKKGSHITEETRLKMSLAKKGKTNHWLGKKRSAYVIKILKERVFSAETRKKMSLSRMGKKRLPETIEKASITRRLNTEKKWEGRGKCIDCNLKINRTFKDAKNKRCFNCYKLFAKNPKNHPGYKGKIWVCSECNKKVSFGSTKCVMHGIPRGEKHPRWRGGITPIIKQIRQSTEYKNWRKGVFYRDRWKCIWCGEKRNIEADHIKQFAYFPELRFELSNGRTLCRPCHRKTDTWGVKRKDEKT